MKEKIGLFDIFLYIIMTFVLVTILYPILHVIAVSFSETAYIVKNEVGILPKGFSLTAYEQVFKNDKIIRSYANTILYRSVGTAFNLLMTAIMAYPLSKSNLVGRNIFIKLVVFTMFFSGGMIPTYLVVKSMGLLNTMWSLIIPNAIWTMDLLILVSFYRGLPISLFESAMLDGASEYQILFRLVLPLSKAALASVGLFYFMGHWNSYFLPLIYLQDAVKFPVQLVLRDMLLKESMSTSHLSATFAIPPAALKNATIFVTMVPVMLVYPFVQKFFVKGVMIGSIKG